MHIANDLDNCILIQWRDCYGVRFANRTAAIHHGNITTTQTPFVEPYMQRPNLSLLKATLAAAMLFGAVASAFAGTCSFDSSNTNPDATLTDASACGPGSGANDSAALVNTAEPSSATWVLYDKTDEDVAGSDAELTITGTTFDDGKPTTGTWSIDTPLSLSDYNFLLVIKDGSTIGNVDPKWFWFIVDESPTTDGCASGIELCGTWEMYGTAGGGARKGISHMSLYVSQGGTGPQEIPEPSGLALAGIGLMGLWAARRRSRATAI
jgi:hypothetical protein